MAENPSFGLLLGTAQVLVMPVRLVNSIMGNLAPLGCWGMV